MRLFLGRENGLQLIEIGVIILLFRHRRFDFKVRECGLNQYLTDFQCLVRRRFRIEARMCAQAGRRDKRCLQDRECVAPLKEIPPDTPVEAGMLEDCRSSVRKTAAVLPDRALQFPQGVSGFQKFTSSAFLQSAE